MQAVDQKIQFAEQTVLIVQKQLRPQRRVEPGHPGHIPVAAGGKARLGERRGAFDVGVGHQMRQLGVEGDHLVVALRRGGRKVAELRGCEQLPCPAQQGDIVPVLRHQQHRRAAEQIRTGVFEAGLMGARHGMPAQEGEAVFFCQRKARRADTALDAAAVDHNGLFSKIWRKLPHCFHGCGRIDGDQDQIALGDVLLGQLAVHCAAHAGKVQHAAVAFTSQHGPAGLMICLGKRAADQPQADDPDRHPIAASRTA